MSEPETSGEPAVAPAVTPSAPPAPAAAPSFGASRGSGLARGKRVSAPVAAAVNNAAPKGDYKPTAVQVITSEREYKNPFAPEQPAVVAPIVTNDLPAAQPPL